MRINFSIVNKEKDAFNIFKKKQGHRRNSQKYYSWLEKNERFFCVKGFAYPNRRRLELNRKEFLT